jgi:hypothetical protein
MSGSHEAMTRSRYRCIDAHIFEDDDPHPDGVNQEIACPVCCSVECEVVGTALSLLGEDPVVLDCGEARFFIDSEFLEDGMTIMPISLAVVALDGRELYLEFEFDEEKINAFHDPFVRDHVLPHLERKEVVSLAEGAKRIAAFVEPTPPRRRPEFWGYYADYDWVLLCRLFGRMVDLPPFMPKYCMDLQQWWKQLGCPEGLKPPKPKDAHNALADARWMAAFWKNLASTAQAGR